MLRVVVIGAGFGGVYALRRLHRRFHRTPVRFHIIDPKNYFLFTPLLHEVATGSLAPHTIVEPIRKVFGCCPLDIVIGEARLVRLADKVVETDGAEVPYDALIIASGAETNFYGVPGAAEHALTLKSLADAAAVKRAMITAFDDAAAGRAGTPRFAVVGGGPTGVELAAEMVDFVNGTLAPSYRGAVLGRPEVVLLQQGPELLPQFSPPVRQKAVDTLRRKGIEVRLSTTVVSVEEDGAVLDGGERVPASAVVWVAGVRPSLPAFDADLGRDANGRVRVGQTLELPGHQGVFVIGDAASFAQDGVPLPPFAQVAVAQASHAADNLARRVRGGPLADFRYRHRGNLVSLGQWMAAAEIGPLRFWGHFAWWLWRTVYLTKFISLRKKFSIALQWTINLVSPRDASML